MEVTWTVICPPELNPQWLQKELQSRLEQFVRMAVIDARARVEFERVLIDDDYMHQWWQNMYSPAERLPPITRASTYAKIESRQELAGFYDGWKYGSDQRRPVLLRGSRHARYAKGRDWDRRFTERVIRHKRLTGLYRDEFLDLRMRLYKRHDPQMVDWCFPNASIGTVLINGKKKFVKKEQKETLKMLFATLKAIESLETQKIPVSFQKAFRFYQRRQL
jgi:uncharacterized protein YlzI (FlbEa/FlbD family)